MEQLKIQQLDYRYILIDSYKELGLNEEDLAILLVVDNILKDSPMLITAEVLALKMTLDVKTLDKELVSLVSRGFLEYDNVDNTIKTSFAPTLRRIRESLIKSFVREDALERDQKKEEAVGNIYSQFEKELGRPLAPLEFEKIREWISQGIDEQLITNCLEECLSKSTKLTLRAVDKCIIKRLSSKDIEKEGYSSLNEKWKKDIEETIDIANTKWTDR